jgi:alpha-tubulin suppressor-like RCC1 family protein
MARAAMRVLPSARTGQAGLPGMAGTGRPFCHDEVRYLVMHPQRSGHPARGTLSRRSASCRVSAGRGAAALSLAAAVTAAMSIPAAAMPRPAARTAAPAVASGQFVMAWGANVYGELGDGTTTGTDTPQLVHLPGGQRYTVVRCLLFCLAATASGRAYGWGMNAAGQLGDGTTKQRLLPVRVRLPAGVKVRQVRTGGEFSLALTTGGKVLAWGANTLGQLGNGSSRARRLPVRVHLPRGVTVTAISAGFESSLALTSTGRVLSWGGNGSGQLGDGGTKGRRVPGYVRLPRHTKVTAIAAGSISDFAVTSAGRLLAWGNNQNGMLGDGTLTVRKAPVLVRLPKGVKVSAVAVGLQHTLALTRSGKLLAWGSDLVGQLGNGSTTERHTPAWVRLPSGAKITAVVAGKYFSMALTTKHQVLTWGDGGQGELGNGTDGGSNVPVHADLPPGYTAVAIGAGYGATTAMAIVYQLPV